jgi:RsiW-degrading membrane proteinase PrsW (M82 family)
MSLARQPAYWLFLLFVGGCSLIVGGEQLSYLGSLPGAWLLSLVLLAATAIPAGIIIYRLDQFEPEPASLIAVALLWGGIVAVTFASITNSYALSFLQHALPALTVDSWGAAIVAPINEEFYKGAGLVIIYLMARSEFDGLMDGLIYGAMIGIGVPGGRERAVLRTRGLGIRSGALGSRREHVFRAGRSRGFV